MKSLLTGLILCLAAAGLNAQQTITAPLTLIKNIGSGANGPMNISDAYYLKVGNLEYNINSYRLIGFGYDATKPPAFIGFQEKESSGATQGDLIFGTRNNIQYLDPTERMRITSGGNVGIGTSSPIVPLDVTGSVRLTGGLYNETTEANTTIRLKPAASNTATISGIFEAYEKADLGNSASALFGIANTDWAAPLPSVAIMSTQQGTGVTKDIMIWAHDSPSAANAALCIKANSNNIGIGTTNPGTYKLAVEGTIGARKVKVINQATPWADFVFEPSYALPTLKEVEQHIKAKKHLPGIPSAKEISQEGLDLGDMQQKQMQKIEELTLYIIELNKKLEEQGKQLEALKKEK